MHLAQYLSKSRHGIWYYRWVVPERIRAKHPQLPKELKRFMRTADIRLARTRARRLHITFAVPLMSVNDPSSFPDLSNIRPFTVDMDPTTGRVTRITAKDHEWPAAREAARHINADSEAAGLLTPEPDQ